MLNEKIFLIRLKLKCSSLLINIGSSLNIQEENFKPIRSSFFLIKIMASTVTILQSIISSMICVGHHQELTFISELNNFFNLDHNIFVVHASKDTNRFISAPRQTMQFTTPQSLYVFEDTDGDNITGLEPLTEIKSKSTFLIVVPGVSNFDGIINLLSRMKEIQRLQIQVKIGIFFSDITSSENLQKLFEWSWKQQIINIFVCYSHAKITQGSPCPERLLNCFTYNPFGTFDVVNVTGSKRFGNFFVSQISNFQQHPLRFGHSFPYTSDENLWSAVLRVMNASFVIDENKNNYTLVSDLFDNGIDILPLVHNQNDGFKFNSYPVYLTKDIIVVPKALPYAEFTAYLQSITSETFFSYALAIIAVVILLLSFFRYIKKKKFLFFQSVTDVFNLLMNDNGTIEYRQLTSIENLLIVPLTFVGFIIVNGILSNLQSYLTRAVLQPQIDTLEDIYNSPYPVLVWDDAARALVSNYLENQSKFASDWRSKIRVIRFDCLLEEVGMYNRSISFLFEVTLAQSLLKVQKRFNIKGYHASQAEYSNLIYAYPVNDIFPFIERLNEIIHWIQSAGLYEQWWKYDGNAYDNQFIQRTAEYLKNRGEDEVEKIPIPMFIVYGWIASFTLLIIEIIWNRFGKFISLKKNQSIDSA